MAIANWSRKDANRGDTQRTSSRKPASSLDMRKPGSNTVLRFTLLGDADYPVFLQLGRMRVAR